MVDWSALDRDRSGFQQEFVRLLRQSPQLRGQVLDIGCGGNLPTPLHGLSGSYNSLDGVDPDPNILKHPLLNRKCNERFETARLSENFYDLAYAYNVLEHIAEPRPFFAKVAAVLKPNGVFWGLTPNACHPFAVLSRTIELIGLKPAARQLLGHDETGAIRVNNYPAYYRCNSPASILRAIKGLAFARASFFYYPCVQWDHYFPSALRWAPRTWDYLFSTRIVSLMQILIVRLDKAQTPEQPCAE